MCLWLHKANAHLFTDDVADPLICKDQAYKCSLCVSDDKDVIGSKIFLINCSPNMCIQLPSTKWEHCL